VNESLNKNSLQAHDVVDGHRVSTARQHLGQNVALLRAKVSKNAYIGVLIAAVGAFVATILATYYQSGEVNVEAVLEVQKSNFALWMMYAMPFFFAFWGQYSTSIIAYEAGAMVFDQTQSLRLRADGLQEKVTYSTTHDQLTGLLNKTLFYERVEQGIRAAGSAGRNLAVVMIEIENSKEIYDTLGRNSSDIVIKQIATRMKGIVSASDSLARLDGNMFSLLLTDVGGREEVELIAKNVFRALDINFVVARVALRVDVNIGIVQFPQHGEDVDTLVQRAGVALYVAQSSAQGYAFYESSYDQHSPRHLTLMSELRQGIADGELELFYQGKVSLASGQLCGAEALVRWNHSVQGLIQPSEFIPMAERTRLMGVLTAWVLRDAFAQCARWHQDGYDFKVSVNLSAKDLHDPALTDLIVGAAADAGIEPHWVILEITESSILKDPERSLEITERLSEIGFGFSIDDFGTGYSSLSNLKNLPLSEVKIDRSFVSDVLTNDSDATIVKATVNLAHNLGLEVTAEGVENEAIMNRLGEYGVDVVQGYHIGEPLAAESFIQQVNATTWAPVKAGNVTPIAGSLPS
jgi:diguanylate cyclase (GGDEF)-like protein